MTYHGTVENGIIQIQGGLQLPEGAKVRIEVEQKAEAHAAVAEGASQTIWQKLFELGRSVEAEPCDLPADLAVNHDHYLHGQPKRQ